MYDVVIVGAGPAGANLARLLNNKYKVLLIDKRDFIEKSNNKIEKSCGGLLAPDAQKMMAKLMLGIPKEVLAGPQMFSVDTIDIDNNIENYYQRHYINVDREKLDKYMVSLVPENVETLFDAVYKKHEQVDNNIKVSLLYKGEEREIYTKILVGGDGGLSLVRKIEFKNSPFPEKYVSIQNWYKTDKIMPFYTSIFNSKITDYYSWIIQKDDYLLIGTAIPKGIDVNEKFSLLIDTLKERDFQIGELYKKTGTIILRTRKLNQISLAKGNVALIGEAAGLISPSSAEGISYALKSSEMLANSINQFYLGFAPHYIKKCRKIKGNILVKNMKIPFMYNSLLRKLVMKSKIFSMDIKK